MGILFDFLKKYRKMLWMTVAAILLFFVFKYVLTLMLPFVIAALFVYFFSVPLHKVSTKLHIGKGVLAGIFLLIILLLLAWLTWKGSAWGMEKCSMLLHKSGYYEERFCAIVKGCCCSMESKFGMNAEELEHLIIERTGIFWTDMKADLVPKIFGKSILYGKACFEALLFVLVTFIAVVFLAKDGEMLLQKVEENAFLEQLVEVIHSLLKLTAAYIRAQLAIIIVVVLICFLGFALAGFGKAPLWGVVTGMLDVLPFIGTGSVLLPLALVQLLLGKSREAVILTATFIVSALAREFLEPKLVGRKMGVLPVAILFAVYVGARVFGVAGVFLGPVYLLFLLEFYKKLSA